MWSMNAGSKLLVALLAALLAFGLVACGGDEGSGSGASNAASQEQGQSGKSDGGGSQTGTATTGAGGEGGPDSGGGSGDSDDSGGGSGGAGSSFVPRRHEDSGGGATQYRVEGGDNSVQEFGAEAEDSEREAAAQALHNFLDARAQEAWGAACSYLSGDVRESLEDFAVKAQKAAAEEGKAEQSDTGCAGILGRVISRAALPELRKEAAEADVGSLRIEGDRAFLIYSGAGGTTIAIPVVNEDGGWKVASLAGTPLS